MSSMVTGIIAAGSEACDVVIKGFTCMKVLGTELETCLQQCL